MRRSRIVATCAAVAAVAAGGAVYVGTHTSGSTSRPTHARPVVRTAPLSAGTDAPTPTRAGVAAAVSRLLRSPALGGAPAVVVADGDTGTVRFQQRPRASVPPASTAKLLTAVAALDGLGPDARLTTGVFRDADTLHLVGGGDMTLVAQPRVGYPVATSMAQLARRTAAHLSDHPAAVTLRYDAGAWRGPAF